MVGVPSASAATVALLFLVGIVLIAAGLLLARRRLAGLQGVERIVAVAVVASLLSVPLLAWRVVEDMRYTTGLDPYERANAGPIQAFLPGYLVDRANAVIPRSATWATGTGRVSSSTAAAAFPPLALVTLFPRVSASPAAADWILTLGESPGAVAPVTRTLLLLPAAGQLPAARLGEAER
jgi:hypothetical protein